MKTTKKPKLIEHDDPRLRRDYPDILVAFPNAQFVRDENGVFRFKENALVRWLMDGGKISLNDMAVAFQNGHFKLDEYMEFYQGLGYSLSGFLEIGAFDKEVRRRFRKHSEKS